jgi:hypothetical protein
MKVILGVDEFGRKWATRSKKIGARYQRKYLLVCSECGCEVVFSYHGGRVKSFEAGKSQINSKWFALRHPFDASKKCISYRDMIKSAFGSPEELGIISEYRLELVPYISKWRFVR